MLANFLQGCPVANTGHVDVLSGVLLVAPGVVRTRNAADVVVSKFAVGAVYHATKLASIDEEDMAAAVAELTVLTIAG